MSTLKDNSLLLKKEIKKNFELFSQDNNGIIETEQLAFQLLNKTIRTKPRHSPAYMILIPG